MASQNTRGSLFTGISKRGFSSTNQVNNTPAYMMGALGLSGLAYVSYMSSELSGGKGASMARGEVLMSNLVQ